MGNLPSVCVFGVTNIELHSKGPVPNFETDELECFCYETDEDLHVVLAKHRPHVIVSIGQLSQFAMLNSASLEVRKKWLHYENGDDLVKIGEEVFTCFLTNVLQINKSEMVSVFTPAYKSESLIARPFVSLLQQTWQDWEWIIVDDSDDDGKTYESLQKIADTDERIKVLRMGKHSGRIGEVKRIACSVAKGDYLVELDHDDELLPEALEWVVKGFRHYDGQDRREFGGFLYTDFAECFEHESLFSYGKNWGLGYGSYRQEKYRGKTYNVSNGPNVNPKTIRHIVAAPNHIRAWRKKVYQEIGGHCCDLHVADDYELMVRTFLHTRMIRVPKFCYLQYRNISGNTHQVRIREIQRLVRYISQSYDKQIHERFLELGIDDFVWNGKDNTFYRLTQVQNKEPEQHCSLIVKG